MAVQKTAKQVKQVNVIYTYKFNKINRICFTVLSSNEKEQYNTCFDKDENHGSCSCPALRGCYHLDQLKARAAEYFQSRQSVQAEKANPVAEAQAFIARVQAEQAAKYGLSIEQVQEVVARARPIAPLHNAAESHFEERGGRTVPMR